MSRARFARGTRVGRVWDAGRSCRPSASPLAGDGREMMVPTATRFAKLAQWNRQLLARTRTVRSWDEVAVMHGFRTGDSSADCCVFVRGLPVPYDRRTAISARGLPVPYDRETVIPTRGLPVPYDRSHTTPNP
jgi:hypothetical protein